MAEKKWKLGELEFDTEQEYLNASKDLKKIKLIMQKYDITKPADARAVLKEITDKPVFVSSYGLRFVEKLEKTAGPVSDAKSANTKSTAGKQHKDASHRQDKGTAARQNKSPAGIQDKGAAGRQNKSTVSGKSGGKKAKPPKESKEKNIHIITKRNIIIGVVIIALAVSAKFLIPVVLPQLTGESGEQAGDTHRNLVLAYAKNQVELQRSFYNYYKNVMGQEADAATASANEVITNAYCINLSNENVTDYSDKQIEEVYVKLTTAGELVNNSFNEPQAITDLKSEIALSGAAGQPGSDANEESSADEPLSEGTGKVNLVNRMMDYQHRIAAQLTYGYSQFDFSESDVQEYVAEDMERIFGHVIYDMQLSDSEKETYYNVFVENGFFSGSSLVRLGTNPVEQNLPDLTPTISIRKGDGKEETMTCSQQTLAPAASVAYELHAGKKNGYLIFRKNGTGTGYIQDDDGNSVTTQGDMFLIWDGEITVGEWYYNSAQIGFLVDDEKSGGIQYVYDLEY